MANILSLESSSEVCSVCVSRDSELIHILETKEAFSHTRKMTLYIKECLEQAQISIQELDAIAVSDGPGSYTGLRVSAATAKGLCYGLKVPLIAVDTLRAIAWEARNHFKAERYIPMIDARRMEVYTAVYDRQLALVEETHNLILDNTSFSSHHQVETVLCGTGVEKSRSIFQEGNFHLLSFDLSSRYLIELAHQCYEEEDFVNMVSYSPNYFKAPKVTTSKKPLF